MLSVSKPMNAAQAQSYFKADDYYLKEGGSWFGQGALALGLTGAVNAEDFQKLTQGNLADQTIQHGQNETHVAGTDLTFSAPKSVSLLSLVDDKVRAAHEKAVESTLALIEKNYLEYRQTQNGRTETALSEKMVAARFNHLTSRELDPQLHTHAFVLNLTQRPDGEWRAVHNYNFYANQLLFGQLYRNELASQLKELGYAIEITDTSKGLFEVQGVPRELLKAFSQRRQQVEARVEELRASGQYTGASRARLYEIAALDSRAAKPEEIDKKVLLESWQKKLTQHDLTLESLKNSAIEAHQVLSSAPSLSGLSADEAVLLAGRILTENESVFKKEDLLRVAARLSLGEQTGHSLQEAFERAQQVKDIWLQQFQEDRQNFASMIEKSTNEDAANSVIRLYLDTLKDRLSILPMKEVQHRLWENIEQQIQTTDSLTKARAWYDALEHSSEKLIQERTQKMLDLENHQNALKEQLKTASSKAPLQQQLKTLEKQLNQLKESAPALEKLADENAYTTQWMKRTEAKVLKMVKAGKGTITPALPLEEAKTLVQQKFNMLTTGQQNALEHIFSSQDFVVGVQGDAGTGKTTMLNSARSEFEQRGYQVRGLSFTGKAAQEIQESAKIPSQTLHSFLANPKVSENPKQVWVVDEASMVGTRQLHHLLNIAQAHQAQIVLVGDTKQLQTIEAGPMFQKLQEKEAMKTVRMSEVLRQQTPAYRDLVNEVSGKRIENAFRVLNENQLIQQLPTAEILPRLVDDYVQQKNPYQTLIVTSYNRDREALNQMIRQNLQDQGRLPKQQMMISTRESKSITTEEKHFAQNYALGDWVTITSSGAGIKRGAEGRVKKIDHYRNSIVIDTGQEQREIDVRLNGGKLAIAKDKNLELATGEKIVFTKNSKTIGVKNGTTGVVENLQDDGTVQAKLESGQTLQFNLKNYNYLDYGYALTEYKSQGQTAKNVMIHAPIAEPEYQKNYNAFYVAITRGKHEVQVYTDNQKMLQEEVAKVQEKTSTLDYLNPKPKELEKKEKNLGQLEDSHKAKDGSQKNEADLMWDQLKPPEPSQKSELKQQINTLRIREELELEI